MANFEIFDVAELFPGLYAWAEPYLKAVDRHRELAQLTVVLDRVDPATAFGVSESAVKRREVHDFDEGDHVLSIHKCLLNPTLAAGAHENINLILPKGFVPPPDRERVLCRLEELTGKRIGRGTAGICLFCNRPGYSWTVHTHAYSHRLHIPLFSSAPNYFYWVYDDRCDYVCMEPGRAYLLRTDIPHSAFNASGDLRVNLVLDVQ